MTDTLKLLRTKARCGACKGKIGHRVNLVELDRKATWEYPTGGDVLTGESGKAIAVLCDGCIDEERTPVEAVEISGGEDMRYHPVEELEATGA